jgi:peptidoglycan hydrolase CwlO-like protein
MNDEKIETLKDENDKLKKQLNKKREECDHLMIKIKEETEHAHEKDKKLYKKKEKIKGLKEIIDQQKDDLEKE